MFGRRLINNGGAVCPSDVTDLFEDGSGVALYRLNSNADDSSGNYDGTATNVTYVSGHIDNAGSFNGSSSYVTLPTSMPINFSSFTFSAWCKVNSLPSNTAAIGEIRFTGSYPNHHLIGIYASQVNGKYRYLFRNKVDNQIDFEANAPTLSTWNLFTLSYDGTTLNGYLNGVSVLSQAFTVTSSTGSITAIILGEYSSPSFRQLNGSIDQVRIFDRAITSTEVTTLYNEVAC